MQTNKQKWNETLTTEILFPLPDGKSVSIHSSIAKCHHIFLTMNDLCGKLPLHSSQKIIWAVETPVADLSFRR